MLKCLTLTPEFFSFLQVPRQAWQLMKYLNTVHEGVVQRLGLWNLMLILVSTVNLLKSSRRGMQQFMGAHLGWGTKMNMKISILIFWYWIEVSLLNPGTISLVTILYMLLFYSL